jgi:hypothetical protein
MQRAQAESTTHEVGNSLVLFLWNALRAGEGLGVAVANRPDIEVAEFIDRSRLNLS